MRGDSAPVAFVVTQPGTVTARAEWSGGASRLRLTLKPRGGERTVARAFGSSPLSLSHELSAETLRALGNDWVIELISLGEAAGGEITISWPEPPLPPPVEQVATERRRASRVLRDNRRARVAEGVRASEPLTTTTPPSLPPTGGSGGEARRTVLSDGDVRIDYADGSALILHAGCGTTRILPDGTKMKTSCNQVQGAGLPAPPGGDPAFGGFLDGHAENLLSQIRHLVGNDTQAMANYMAVEAGGASTVVERIDLRRRYVDRLLGMGF